MYFYKCLSIIDIMIPNLLTLKFTKLTFILSLFFLNLCLIVPANAKHIVIFGDSLSAAYGMDIEQGWVHLLNQSLNEKYSVSNASISGETTAGGLARLPLTLDTLKPDIVIIALGANDGLRGYSANTLADNLTAMVTLVKEHNATPVLAGISIPRSYGPRYIEQIRAVFPTVATQNDIKLIELFRDDFFNTPEFIQSDGLHPTVITQPLIRNIVLSFLVKQGLIEQDLVDNKSS